MIKKYLFPILIFFRIIDAHDGTVSLTNLGIIIILFKLAMTPSTNMMDIGSLFIATMNYNYRKFLNKQTITQAANIATQIVTKSEELSSS